MIIYTKNWEELIEKFLEIKKKILNIENGKDKVFLQRKWKGQSISTQKMERTDKLLEIKWISEGFLI